MAKQSVQITKQFLDACRDLGAKDPEHGSSVPERCREIVQHARVGQWLEPWRVEIVMCLITRLEPYKRVSSGSWIEQQNVLETWKLAPRKEVE